MGVFILLTGNPERRLLSTLRKFAFKLDILNFNLLIMRRILPILVLFFLSVGLRAQQVTPPCGFDDVLSRQLATDPEFSLNVEEVNRQINDFIEREKKSGSYKAGTVLTIPMVFHVIHLGEAVGTGTNISDAQVESAVRGLNVNYRNNKNWGTSSPAAPFHPNGVDVEIEFCLAQRDPNGQPTNGITRVKGDIFTDYMTKGCINNSSVGTVNEGQIFSNQGWDKNKYYNVYVVAEINDQGGNGSGNVGYAYFPGGSLDGTVVIWKSCGYCGPGDPCPFKNSSLVAPYDNGTMVHEMGHAFSLYHTFEGNANSGGSSGGTCASNDNSSNCTTRGDRVCDTDPHVGNLGSCPSSSTNNVCTGGPYNIYISANVMNYTSCTPLLFTAGQRDRVRANVTTNSVRKNLTLSDACNAVYPYDIALMKISEPSGYYCNSNVGGVVTVKNMGGNTITSFTLEILIDGSVASTHTWNGTLASNTTTTVTVTPATSPNGTHTYQLRVVPSSLNGNTQTDGLSTNNSISTSFEVISNGALVTLTAEDYSDGDNVVVKNTGASGTTIKTITLGAYSGPYTENICLPPGCYDFVFTDQDFQPMNYPAGEQKVPTFEIKDDHGYLIASGIADQYASSGAEIGQPKSETAANKCLPYDPGYLTAAFKANKFVVEVGASVSFTDTSFTSTGTNPATSWLWKFGDGNTSNAQNPVYAYSTPGVYTVELIANNAVVPDTASKLHYIRVIPALTGCDKLDNLISGETPVFKSTVDGDAGYYPGPNNAFPVAYAERFYTPATAILKSVDVFVGYAKAGSPSSEITVLVQTSTSNGLPASTMAIQKFPISSLSIGNYTTIPLSTPISVYDFFFITVQMNNPNGDTIVLGSSDYRPSDDYSNTGFALVGGSWKPINKAFATSGPASLAITANLSVSPLAKYTSSTPKICANKPLTYDASISTNVTTYEWSFQGGIPSTSSDEKPVVTYSTEGSKTVQLVVHGGCGESDTIIQITTVSPFPTLTIDVIDDVCNGQNGKATAKTVGGSGDFVYSWATNPPQSGPTISKLYAGSYTVTLTDIGCGVVSQTATVNNLNKLGDFNIDVNHTTCGGDNGSAVANPVGGSGTYSYKWTKAGDPNFLQTGKTAVNLSPGIYTVEVQDATCNPNQKTVAIEPSDLMNTTISSSKDQICEGESIILSASGGSIYDWTVNGNPVSNMASFTQSPSISTDYRCRITDDRGCFTDLKKFVAVTIAPKAYARATDGTGSEYQDSITVDLVNGGYVHFSSSGSLGNTFFWTFGDGQTASEKNPLHQYTTSGSYNVSLDVLIENCKTTDYTFVNVIGNTGIDSKNEAEFILFPNPTEGVLTIINPGKMVIQSVTIYDLLGKEVASVPGNLADKNIDLGHLNNGSYVLKIKTEKGESVNRISLVK